MKSILTVMLAMVAGTLFAQEKTDSIKVLGNCGMCKSRIEKAAKAGGATTALWNKDSKMLTVTYAEAKTTNEEIQKKVASVGHDTEKFKAEDKVYDKLPGCCLYDRNGSAQKNDHGDHKHK